jgi:TRAP-type C4-dicarboxylate transport system permease small subunit
MAAVNRLAGTLARGFARLEDLLLALLLTGMIGLASAQILLRNAFGSGFAWGDPLLRLGVLWLALLGAMAASRDGGHITVDALTRLLPARAKRIVRFSTDLFTATVCAVIAWHAAGFVQMDRQAGVEFVPGLPAWWAELILPIGFAVVGLRYLADALARRPGAAA